MFCYFFHDAREIKAKYKKWGKYLLILHKGMYDNYCIFKFFLKSNIARVFVSSRKPYGRITKHKKKQKKPQKTEEVVKHSELSNYYWK